VTRGPSTPLDAGPPEVPAEEAGDARVAVHIGSDHAGFDLKAFLVGRLRAAGHEVTDHGAFVHDPGDDYPPFCVAVGEATVADPGAALGVVIGGSGNGEQIAANKVRGVRAVLAWNLDVARLGRSHNDANVIAIGARQHTPEEAWALVEAFVGEAFSGDERHRRRIDLLTAYERWPGHG
jgi:ribose 5-phosphate isomerase B